MVLAMPQYRVAEAAGLLGVSDDTVRRWIDTGQLPGQRDDTGRLTVDGVALANFARAQARAAPDPSVSRRSTFTFPELSLSTSGISGFSRVDCCWSHRLSLQASRHHAARTTAGT